MEPVVVVSLIMATGSLLVSVLTHIKHSQCCGAEFSTYSPIEKQKM